MDTVEFLHFDPEISGRYFAMQPDSKFWSDCCIFHPLIPPNASLPLSSISVSDQIQWRVTLGLVAENKSVAFEMVELGPLEPPTFKCDMLMSEAQNIGLWGKTTKTPHFFSVCLLSSMDYCSIFSLSLSLCLSPIFFLFLLPGCAPVSCLL